ncbi:MAG: T9SS type A sorting domain-containing protein, partial [Bacteroidales bacterium]|nr:T9SS type A sorting domain-containing protein [Bacteroidales bacterium]
HGSMSGCIFVEDHNQNPESALSFPLSTSEVTVQNSEDLNFRDGITVSFWINIASFFDREIYPISHGNWQNRWKISIGDRRLRFTINGENGIIDLDTESQLDKDVWYYVVVLYNGWGCEIYINAELDAFAPIEGLINTTAYDLIFGQSLPGQSGFDFKGTLNNVRIYNYGISYDKIIEIYNQELSAIEESDSEGTSLDIFPNPVNKTLTIEMQAIPGETLDIFLRTIHGKQIKQVTSTVSNGGYFRKQLDIGTFPPGIYMLTISNREFNITHKVMIIK